MSTVNVSLISQITTNTHTHCSLPKVHKVWHPEPAAAAVTAAIATAVVCQLTCHSQSQLMFCHQRHVVGCLLPGARCGGTVLLQLGSQQRT
jgi:hypothetical protein